MTSFRAADSAMVLDGVFSPRHRSLVHCHGPADLWCRPVLTTQKHDPLVGYSSVCDSTNNLCVWWTIPFWWVYTALRVINL